MNIEKLKKVREEKIARWNDWLTKSEATEEDREAYAKEIAKLDIKISKLKEEEKESPPNMN